MGLISNLNLTAHKTLTKSCLTTPRTQPKCFKIVSLETFIGFRSSGFSPALNLSKVSVKHSHHGLAARNRGSRNVVYALFEKFTERSIKIVMLAQEWARNNGDAEVGPIHVLLGLISEDMSKTGFLGSGITIDTARTVVDALAKSNNRPKPIKRDNQRDIPFSRAGKSLFEAALQESRRIGMSFITPEHFFIALTGCGDAAAIEVMQELGMDTDRLRVEALRRLRGETEAEGARKRQAESRSNSNMANSSGSTQASPTQVLEEYCVDLCAEAAANNIDPVIGRSKEVARVAQILARRMKNNPILLGEPGVGKSAVAAGLAKCIVDRSFPDGSPLPEFLLGKRVMSLDVGILIAGAKERGELESRVTKILAEIRSVGNIILMIDEIHALVGAGSVGRGGGGGGGLDISNLLKPALGRGELQCIGATTLDEHRKYIEKDAALERRFQPVVIGEPSEEDTLSILEGLVDRYERHHRCIYSSDALLAAVKLSSRYIADRFFPDKAIDLIDEAGSRVRIVAYNALKDAGEEAMDAASASYSELKQVMETKEEAAKDFLYEEATLLRTRELELKSKLSGLPENAAAVPIVSVEHIASIVAAWTGVPVEQMGDDEREKLLALPHTLRGQVIGQEEAVESTAKAIARAASGLKNPARPIATLMFSGPTGVGKTQLAKSLALAHFGSEQSMIRLDMSEFMERHTVSKLIGSPPGYIGYNEGGQLTEAIRRRPYTVVLFDEIEKAHPDVFNALLQIIEDGRLTDSQGRTVSFKNALIVLTTNVGSSVVAKGGAGIGFELPGDEDVETSRQHRLRALVMEELKSYFRPELLNRLDELVVFKRLSKSDVAEIANLELAKTSERAAERGIVLRVEDSVMDLIIEEGYSETMGARELRRAITRIVDDALSDAILTGKVLPGQIAVVKRAHDVTDSQFPVRVVAVNDGGAEISNKKNDHGGKKKSAIPALQWMQA